MSKSSTFSQLLSLGILVVFLAGLAFVGWQIYVSLVKIQEQARKQMGKKDVVFTKEGVRVGVKHVETEKYVDRTQQYVVKAWDLAAAKKEEERKNKKGK